MSGFVLGHRPDAVKVLAVDQERRMRRIDELIFLGELIEEPDESLLRGRMQMHPRLVEQQESILVPFLRLDQKHQVEGEKPLETLTAALQLDLHAGAPVVRHPNPEIVAVCLIVNRVPALLVPVIEAPGNVERT
jgi:hypothetical protein